MNRFTFCIAALAAAALTGAAGAEPDAGKEKPLRLVLDLVDGSRVIGVPDIEWVPAQTAYAKMNVPLKQIRSLQIGKDHETAAFCLQNGDKLTGVIKLATIKLTTVFGQVAVGVEYIQQIDVMVTGGTLPESLRKGLVLHYAFDRDEKSKIFDGSAQHNDGVVHGAKWTPQGKLGGAYEFDGESAHITVKPAADMPNIGDFTVSLWTYAQERKPQINGSGVSVDRQYILDTHSDAVSGQYQPGFFLVYDFNGSGACEVHNGMHFDSGQDGYTEHNTRVDVAEKWHHLVFGRRGKDDYTYLDGKLLATTYAKEIHRSDLLDLNHTWSIGTFAGNNHPRSRNINYSFKGRMDEVMVFNRALSADEARQLFDSQQ